MSTTDKDNQVILTLKEVGKATAKTLGCSINRLRALAGDGLVEFDGLELGGRGRPAHKYRLTSEGKKLATKLARKVGK